MRPDAAAVFSRLLKTRWLVRTPIWLYRMRLGFVLGHRMLLLEHVGRRSGQRRYAVLEVVERSGADTYVIVSGFGERAQWYRNVKANPHVRVSVGFRCETPAVANQLSREAAAETLDRYARGHPRAWRHLEPTLRAALREPNLELPMFALKLKRR
jgi:deazaflavin-dependent oxidoreductase (nitroreductase family)